MVGKFCHLYDISALMADCDIGPTEPIFLNIGRNISAQA